MNVKRSIAVSLVLVIALLCTPSLSYAAIKGRIVENVGVKKAKLGLHDKTDAKRIGGKYKRVTNHDYDYTVYEFRFGKKSSSGKYGLLMYSKGNHHVFEFVINCTTLKTKNGTHVGTTEAALTDRYGDRLTKDDSGSVYIDYHMGTRKGRTDFYVSGGKVRQIVISRY